MNPTLLILAAGMGSRYGGLKQLDGVGPSGETIMDYSIYDAVRAGFGKVVYVIRRDFEANFKRQVASRWEGIVEQDFVFQDFAKFAPDGIDLSLRQKPWGTAHAILVAKETVREPFVAINADDYYGRSGFEKLKDFLTSQGAPLRFGMVGYVLDNTLSEHGAVSRGVCEADNQGSLIRVSECTGIHRTPQGIQGISETGEQQSFPAETLVSMNLWGFHPHFFELLHKGFSDFTKANASNPKAEFYISSFANDLIRSGAAHFQLLPNDEKWYGVTYQEDKPIVRNAFAELTRQGSYPSPLWKTD